MTADLVAFLRARYDEDRRAAEVAPDGPWSVAQAGPGEAWTILGAFTSLARLNTASDTREVTVRREEIAGADLGAGGVRTREAAEHIARHDPARVLADIDAKRELIRRGDTLFCDCDFADSPPTNPEDRSQEIPHHYGCTAYRIAAVLALPYADHPDYKEKWRP